MPLYNSTTRDVRLSVLGTYTVTYTDKDGIERNVICNGWIRTTAFPPGKGPARKQEAAAINVARAYGSTCVAALNKHPKLNKKILKHGLKGGVIVKTSIYTQDRMKVKIGDAKVTLSCHGNSHNAPIKTEKHGLKGMLARILK